MKIYIIRHAEPNYEKNTLTEKGFKETEILKERLKQYHFDKLYVSTLGRAILTAKAIERPEAIYCKWLEEFCHPILIDGKRVINWDLLPSYLNKHPEYYNNDTYLNEPVFKEADVKKFYDEVVLQFDKILADEGYIRENNYYRVVKPNNHRSICFVCHLGMESVLLSRLLNIPYVIIAQAFGTPPTGITTVISEEREEGIAQFRVTTYGDCAHLEYANEETSYAGRFDECYYDEKNLGGRIPNNKK